MKAAEQIEALCANAKGLVFLQRQDSVLWPVLKILVEAMERGGQDFEDALNRFAEYLYGPKIIPLITHIPKEVNITFSFDMEQNIEVERKWQEDVEVLSEAGQAEPKIAKIMFYSLMRHPILCRNTLYQTAKTCQDSALTARIYLNSENPSLRVCAQALLIQLNATRDEREPLDAVKADDIEKALPSIEDILTRRRIVALASQECPVLPDVITLSDEDAYIVQRAVKRLLAAGACGDELLMAVLRGDDPYAAEVIFKTLTSEPEKVADILNRRPELSERLCRHLLSGHISVRMSAIHCLQSLHEGVLSPFNDVKQTLMRMGGPSDHFQRQCAREIIGKHWGNEKQPAG